MCLCLWMIVRMYVADGSSLPSPRVVVADLSLVSYLSLLCRWSVARLLHSAAPLLHSTRPARIPILLVAFGRHAVHTHSVPRVVSRHSVITHSLFHSCSHRVVAWCGRARDSMGSIGAVARCVVAARLPPSAISVRVQHCNAVHCTAMQCSAQAHSKDGFCVVVSSFWSYSSVVVVRRVAIAASRVFRLEGCMRVGREWNLRLRRLFPWLL